MSILLMTLVWKTSFPTQAQKLIALKLADYASDGGGSVFPARETLAKQAGCSEATAKRTLRCFASIGLLKLIRKGGDGPGNTNEWKLNVPLLEALARESAVLSGGAEELVVDWADAVEKAVDSAGKTGENEGGHDDPLEDGRGSFDPLRGSSCTEKGVASDPQPTKNHHLDSPDARAGACEAGASPSRAGRSGKSFQARLTVRRGDPSWSDWLDALSPAAVERAEKAGAIEVTERWPGRPAARFIGIPADALAGGAG